MKNRKYIYLKITLLLGLIFTVITSCERNPSDDIEFAKFSPAGEVFIDGFSGGLDYFPYQGSYAESFTVDEETKYTGSASMRFDVPNDDDPLGGYAGAIFRVESPRDLSGYDALTFWAKASESRSINDIGFGQDFDENKYQTSIVNLQLTTNWRKYVIPIPDPFKLTAETGMFWFSDGDPYGYSFWIDELQFEKLGTIGQPKPAILNGEDIFQTSFSGSSIDLRTGLSETFNLASGINQTVSVAPSYFTFNSTDADVARVSELGIVSIVGNGTAEITAILNGVKAQGSLTVEVIGQFSPAPIPTLDPNQVISIFSDAYTNVPVDFYNGYYAPFQTTTSNDFEVNGDHILNYENYNFVGIEFNQNVPTIDATEMTVMHLDIFIPDSFDPASTIRVNLVDLGFDGAFGGGDDSSVFTLLSATSTPALVSGEWIGIEFDITGLANRNNLGQIVFDAEGNTTPRPSGFYVDNIYLHK